MIIAKDNIKRLNFLNFLEIFKNFNKVNFLNTGDFEFFRKFTGFSENSENSSFQKIQIFAAAAVKSRLQNHLASSASHLNFQKIQKIHFASKDCQTAAVKSTSVELFKAVSKLS